MNGHVCMILVYIHRRLTYYPSITVCEMPQEDFGVNLPTEKFSPLPGRALHLAWVKPREMWIIRPGTPKTLAHTPLFLIDVSRWRRGWQASDIKHGTPRTSSVEFQHKMKTISQ